MPPVIKIIEPNISEEENKRRLDDINKVLSSIAYNIIKRESNKPIN